MGMGAASRSTRSKGPSAGTSSKARRTTDRTRSSNGATARGVNRRLMTER